MMNNLIFPKSLFFCMVLLSLSVLMGRSYGQKNYGTVRIKNVSKVSGDVKLNGHQGKMEILKYTLDFKDLALKTAKGIITIVKPQDSSTIDWLSAYSESREITSFEIEIFLKNDLNPDFKLITEMGKIISISHKFNDISKQHEEEITISFGKYKMSNRAKKQELEFQIVKSN